MVNSEIKSNSKREKQWEYPCLLTNSDKTIVILAINELNGDVTGTCIYTKNGIIGEYTSLWDKSDLELFNEEVTLSNK